MRSLTQQQIDNHRMDEAVRLFLIGKTWMTVKQIADGMDENEFDVRRALIRLMDRAEVCKQYLKNVERPEYHYELAYGGYSPTGGNAA